MPTNDIVTTPTPPKRLFSEHRDEIYKELSAIPRDKPLMFVDIDFDIDLDCNDVYKSLSLNYETYDKTFPRPISFENCDFNGEFKFHDIRYSKDIIITGSTFYQDVDFNSSTFASSLRINNSTFKKSVNFIGCTFEGDADFSALNEFCGVTLFSRAIFRGITAFCNTTFKGDTHFNFTEFQNFCTFLDIHFEELAKFHKAIFSKEVAFLNPKFLKDCDFTYTQFESVANFQVTEFKNAPLFEKTIFKGTTFLQGIKFCEDTEFINTEFAGITTFERSRFFKKASFGYCKMSDITFINAEFIDDLNFDYVIFEGETILRDIEATKNINFKNVSLNANNIVLSPKSAQDILFENSKITGILTLELKKENFKSIEFRDTFVNPGSLKLRPRKIARKQINSYETARIFKKVMSDDLDNINALHYKSCEMELYRKTLKKSGAEKVLLWLNHKSNNHGDRWDWGFWWLIALWAIFYSLMELVQYSCGTRFKWFDAESLKHALEYLWIPNTNISHPFGKDVEVNAWVMVISIIGKIAMGYCLYQTIAAFRKHGKP